MSIVFYRFLLSLCRFVWMYVDCPDDYGCLLVSADFYELVYIDVGFC